MAEITAGLVKELREMTGLGMMECKKALAEAGGDLKKAEELLRIKSGAKASKAAGRVAAEGVIGAYLSPRRQAGRAGRTQLRDRLRRQERRLPRLRAGAGRSSSRPRTRRTSPRWRLPAERRGRSARRWCRRSARTSPSAASRGCRRRASSRTTCTAAEDRRAGRLRGRRRRRQGPRDAHRVRQAAYLTQGGGAGRTSSQRERDIQRGAREGIRQAGGDRRQDGRGRAEQVPRRDHAARPAVRQGRQADASRRCSPRRRRRCTATRFFVVGEGIEKKTERLRGRSDGAW